MAEPMTFLFAFCLSTLVVALVAVGVVGILNELWRASQGIAMMDARIKRLERQESGSRDGARSG